MIRKPPNVATSRAEFVNTASRAAKRPRSCGGMNSVMRAVADDDLGAEADPHDEAESRKSQVMEGAQAAAIEASPKTARLN